jgi:hypothetical protein
MAYSIVAVTSTFHLRWAEYVSKRHDHSIGGLRVA